MNVLAINPFSIVAPFVLYVVYKVVQYKQEAQEKYFNKKGQIEFEKMYNEKKQELQTMKKVKDYEEFQQNYKQNRKRNLDDFSYQNSNQVHDRPRRNQLSYDRSLIQKNEDHQLSFSNQKSIVKPTKVDMIMPQQQMVCHLCTDCVLNKLNEKQKERKKKKFKKSNMIDLSEIANKEEDTTQSFLQYYKRRQNKFYDILKSTKELNKIQNQDQQIETKKPSQFNSKNDKISELFQNNNKDQFIKDKPNQNSLLTKNENQSQQKSTFNSNIKDINQKSDLLPISLPNKSTIYDNNKTNSNLFNNQKDDQKNLFQNKDLPQEDKKLTQTNSLFINNKTTEKEDEQQKNLIPQPSISFDNKNAQSLLSKQNSQQEIVEQKNTATFNEENNKVQKAIESSNKIQDQNKPLVQNNDNKIVAMRDISDKKSENTNIKSSGMFNNNNQKSSGLFNNNNQKPPGLFNNNDSKSTGLFNNNNQKSSGLFNNNNSKSSNLFNKNQDQNKSILNKDQSNTTSMFQNNNNQNQQQNQSSLFTDQNKQQKKEDQKNITKPQMPQPNNPPTLFNNSSNNTGNKNTSSPFQSQQQVKNSQPGPFFSPNNNNQSTIFNKSQNPQSNKSNISNQQNNKNPFLNSLNNNQNQTSQFSQQAKNYQGGLFQNTSSFQQKNQTPGNIFSKSNAQSQQQQGAQGKIQGSIFNNNNSLFGNNR